MIALDVHVRNGMDVSGLRAVGWRPLGRGLHGRSKDSVRLTNNSRLLYGKHAAATQRHPRQPFCSRCAFLAAAGEGYTILCTSVCLPGEIITIP